MILPSRFSCCTSMGSCLSIGPPIVFLAILSLFSYCPTPSSDVRLSPDIPFTLPQSSPDNLLKGLSSVRPSLSAWSPSQLSTCIQIEIFEMEKIGNICSVNSLFFQFPKLAIIARFWTYNRIKIFEIENIAKISVSKTCYYSQFLKPTTKARSLKLRKQETYVRSVNSQFFQLPKMLKTLSQIF